jgi:hypothetical protein
MQNKKMQMEAESRESKDISGEGMRMNRVVEEEESKETYSSEGKKEG